MDIKIVKEEKDFIVAYKPVNLPTVPLKHDTKETLLSLVGKDYPEVLEINGFHPWEGGVVHRLDIATQGLVLIARDQDFFDFMLYKQNTGVFVKEYMANIDHQAPTSEGWPACPYQLNMNDFCISSYFRAYGEGRSQVRPALSPEEKNATTTNYSTMVKVISPSQVYCQISKGFRHQIRCHLAWMNCPIKGEQLYSKNPEDSELELYCTKLFIPDYGVVNFENL